MTFQERNGHLALFTANILFGLNTVVSRSLMPEIISPYALTYFRIGGSTILFWIASLFTSQEKVPKKDLLLLAAASIFSLVLNQLPFFVGLSATSPINASIIVTTLPIVTMILAAFFLKEPITTKKALGVLVGATGALLLIITGSKHNDAQTKLWGIMIVFFAILCFSIYLTAFKNIVVKYSPITSMKWMFTFASILSFPFCFGAVVATKFSTFTSDIYFRIIFVVAFASFITYLLVPIGQKSLRPTTLSMYNYVQPIVTSTVAIVIGMDSFGAEKFIAAILVFLGVYIVTKSKSRAQLEAELNHK